MCQNASVSEQEAASELDYYMKQVGSVTLPSVAQVPGNDRYIYIGFDDFVALTLQASRMKDDDEGFRIYCDGSRLFIYGGRKRGALYVVYYYLSKMLGVRWYTPSFTKIPRLPSCTLNKIDLHSEPAFRYRIIYCKSALTDLVWAAHNGLNSTSFHY